MRVRETINENKNYLPALGLTVLFWTIWATMFFLVDPVVVADFPIRESYFLFFLVGFLSIWFLFSLLLANKRRGFLVAISLLIGGYLRLWKIDSWLNIFLLVVFLVGLEIYHIDKNKKE